MRWKKLVTCFWGKLDTSLDDFGTVLRNIPHVSHPHLSTKNEWTSRSAVKRDSWMLFFLSVCVLSVTCWSQRLTCTAWERSPHGKALPTSSPDKLWALWWRLHQKRSTQNWLHSSLVATTRLEWKYQRLKGASLQTQNLYSFHAWIFKLSSFEINLTMLAITTLYSMFNLYTSRIIKIEVCSLKGIYML